MVRTGREDNQTGRRNRHHRFRHQRATRDLYRVGKAQRDQILSVLRDNSDRLFIPYQVAYEFQRNRLAVIAGIDSVYKNLAKSLELNKSVLDQIRDEDVKSEIKQLFEQVQRTFKEGLDKLGSEHTVSFKDARKNDPVRQALDKLLSDNALGRPPSDEVLEIRREEAAWRINTGTPPGFGDSDKLDPAGDYLAWTELKDHAKESDRPLLFVTNDEKKGDWYLRARELTIGPRPELVAEMRKVTTHPYHQTNLSSFLHLARKYLGAKVDDDTIMTVENIARETETPAVQSLATSLASPVDPRLIGNQFQYPYGSLVNFENYFQAKGIESPFQKVLENEINAKFPSFQKIYEEQQQKLMGNLMEAYRTPPIGLQGRTLSSLSSPETSEQSSASDPAKKVAAKKAPAKKAQPATKASAGKKPQQGKKSPKG